MTTPAALSTPSEWLSAEAIDRLATELEAKDPFPDDEPEEEDDPSFGPAMRIYEVIEVRPGEGCLLSELTCTDTPPEIWIGLPALAASSFMGDVFSLGWNDRETVVWPPSRKERGPGHERAPCRDA